MRKNLSEKNWAEQKTIKCCCQTSISGQKNGLHHVTINVKPYQVLILYDSLQSHKKLSKTMKI